MTQHRAHIKRGPATWAKVKAAYLAGETARSVAERFGVTVASIRSRSHYHGWTRKAHAAALEAQEAEAKEAAGVLAAGLPSITVPALTAPDAERPAPPGQMSPFYGVPTHSLKPAEQLMDSVRLAARRVAEGRPAEAEALIRASRALMDLTGEPAPTMDQLDPPDDAIEAMFRAVELRAWDILKCLLVETPDPPVNFEAFYFWLRDRGHRRHDGDRGFDRRWAEAHRPDLLHLWDADGHVPEPPPPSEKVEYWLVPLVTDGARYRERGKVR